MEFRLEFDNTIVDVYVDEHLHILDCDVDGTKSLTNAINDLYLKKIVKAVDEKTFDKVYLYHTDGYISEWNESEFVNIPLENKDLYERFKNVCLARRIKHQDRQLSDNEYYLMDLERSIGSGIVHYWKPNKRGYSRNIEEAGLYSKEMATDIVGSDYDHRTVMIHKDVVDQLLNR